MSHLTPGSYGVSLRRHGSNRSHGVLLALGGLSHSVANHTIFLSVFLWHGMMIIFAFTGEREAHIQEHRCWKALGELHC